ncbi:C1q-related factor-like [Branchiostoma lanceolatum]|uniref:C1q-related factor-like n=1 Tax=Branchiostoma lanceolatum TaxID=7740 RepID=UPI003455CA38
MAQTRFMVAVLVLSSVMTQTCAKVSLEEGSCSRVHNDQNITVLALPGPRGHKGAMGARGHQGTPGVTGVAGDPGEQGLVGPTGEKGDAGEQGPAGETGTPGADAPARTVVAFCAARTDDIVRKTSASSNEVVTYNVILTNLGEGYDKNTGKFTATVGGTYFFTFNGLTLFLAYASYYLRLVKNGEFVVGLYENNGPSKEHQSSSNSAIVRLEAGDQVWVELGKGGHSLSSAFHRYLTFNGFLIGTD